MEKYIIDQLENEGFVLSEELKEAIEEHAKTVYNAGILDGSYDSKLHQEAIDFFESNPELKTTLSA